MSHTCTLEAVEGRCCPVPGERGRFYGLKRTTSADVPSGHVVHVVPLGPDTTSVYVSAGPFEAPARADGQPRDAYLRRAVLRGGLRLVEPTKKPAPRSDEER